MLEDKEIKAHELNESGQEPPVVNSSPAPEKQKAKEHSAKHAHEKIIPFKESEYLKMKQEIADGRDRYLRLQAEFDNVRKRMEREKLEFIKYANEGIIQQFLFAVDDLERTIEAAKANHQDYMAFLKGTEMVMTQIYDMLKKNNVKAIETIGRKFDPHCHEALMTQETDEVSEGTIIEEFQKGYMMGERVVRTAKVKVATAKTAKEESQNSKNQ